MINSDGVAAILREAAERIDSDNRAVLRSSSETYGPDTLTLDKVEIDVNSTTTIFVKIVQTCQDTTISFKEASA